MRYEITKQLDGWFLCVGETEHVKEVWREKDLKGAVNSMLRFAKAEGRTFARKGITFLQEQYMQVVVCVPMEGGR